MRETRRRAMLQRALQLWACVSLVRYLRALGVSVAPYSEEYDAD